MVYIPIRLVKELSVIDLFCVDALIIIVVLWFLLTHFEFNGIREIFKIKKFGDSLECLYKKVKKKCK